MVSKTRSDIVRRHHETINHSHNKTHSEFPEGETTPTCTSCPVAKYSDVSSNGPCTSCGNGFTTAGTGSTSASQCICHVGFYLDGSSCTWCGNGFTTASTGSTSATQCVCHVGYYLDGSSCTWCGIGVTTENTGSTSASQCICDKGYYLDGSSCTSCGSGTTESTGSTSASQCICDKGYYLDGSSCTSCVGGTTENTGSTSASDCICNSGYISIDQGVCSIMCAGDDNSDCACDAGFYKNSANACTKCGQGQSSPVGSMSSLACSQCSAGKFYNEPSSTKSLCTDCGIGKYQPNTAQTACADCDAGKAQPTTGASSCVDCSPGHYSNDLGLENCIACNEGDYVGTDGATECFACGATYNREPDINQEKLRQCFCSVYDSDDKCSKGFYKTEIGSSLLCCPCSEATYQPNDNSDVTTCAECSHPREPNDNHDLCVEYLTFQGCDAATHVPVKLIMSDTEGNGWSGTQLEMKKTGVADPLLEGTVGTVGADKFAWGYSTACIPKFGAGSECFTVEFSGGQSSGESEIRWEIFSATIDCLYPTQLEGGNANDLTESTELRVCEASSLIGDGRTGVYSSTPIDWCDVGHCPAGKFRVTTATNTEYGVSDVVNSCAPCVEGMYSNGVGDSCSVCPIGTMSGTRGALTCTDCEGGKYNDDEATDRSEHVECTACGAGRYSTGGINECTVCQINQINVNAVAGSCTQCESGKFTVGALVTDHDEADDCKMCESGEFWKMSESACAACPAGKTSSIENKFECDECGAGRYSAR